MTRDSKIFITGLDVLFVIFLLISGCFSGVLSSVIYILAFIIPIAIGFIKTRDKNSDTDFLSLGGAKRSLPFIAPTILAVMSVSLLTSLLVGWISGKENVVELGDSLIVALISHAVAPAILEEALFRLVPLRAMRGEKASVTVIYSALLFALIHHSFFSMPYAFLAGAVFMLIDLVFDSALPSVIIHFLNNALSVFFIFYADSQWLIPLAVGALVVLSAVSILYLYSNKERFKIITEKITEVGKLDFALPAELLILAVPMLILAVAELIQ